MTPTVGQWLRNSNPGDTFTYHDGLLMRDRQTDALVDVTAKRMHAAYVARQVALTQKRVEPGRCQYVATRL